MLLIQLFSPLDDMSAGYHASHVATMMRSAFTQTRKAIFCFKARQKSHRKAFSQAFQVIFACRMWLSAVSGAHDAQRPGYGWFQLLFLRQQLPSLYENRSKSMKIRSETMPTALGCCPRDLRRGAEDALWHRRLANARGGVGMPFRSSP